MWSGRPTLEEAGIRDQLPLIRTGLYWSTPDVVMKTRQMAVPLQDYRMQAHRFGIDVSRLSVPTTPL